MNLTLIPIAALLFLLSGFGVPAQAHGQRVVTVALMRRLLGREDGGYTRGYLHGTRLSGCRGLGAVGAHRVSTFAIRGVSAQGRSGDVFIRRERKQYRTRFGFAEGAYLAVGPPASASLADLG